MIEKDEKEIIILETDQGFNVYVSISVKEVNRIGITGLQKREPDIFTPDLYKAVLFADEHMRSYTDQKIVFILGHVAGMHRQKQSQDDDQPAEPVRHSALAELCINLKEGQAVVSPEGKIEFHDTGLNISLRDLQFVVQEAEAYMKYRKERNAQTETH